VHLSGLDGLIDATRRAHAIVGVDSGPLLAQRSASPASRSTDLPTLHPTAPMAGLCACCEAPTR
jgi:hypothetical protein